MNRILLSVRGLEMAFGGIRAVCNANMDIADGQLLCIIGPNGAGKTTLLNLLSGLLKPLAGTIRFDDKLMTGRPFHDYARMGIVRKFQVPNVFNEMSVRDNLIVAGLGVGTGDVSRHRVEETLQLIGLVYEGTGSMSAGTLSHGQKQWLEIGMALMCRPRLLLLDEPAAGMTSEESQKLATTLMKTENLSIVIIEHDMKFVRALHCRTVVMHHGQIICDDDFRNVEQDSYVRDIYLGRQ